MRTRARSVALLVFDEVELLDVAAPLEVLSLAGRNWNFRPFKVELVAVRPGLVTTRNQARIEATRSLDSVANPDILIVPGGYGARRLAEDSTTEAEIARLASTAEIVAAIGWGVAVLARAGCTKAARLAAPEQTREFVLSHTPDAELDPSARWLESGRLISARASGAALDLAFAIVARTLGIKLVNMVAADLGLDPPVSVERIEILYPEKGA